MKAFEEFYQKHPEILFKQSVHSIGEAYWKAALEWVLSKVPESNSDGSLITYINEELYEQL